MDERCKKIQKTADDIKKTISFTFKSECFKIPKHIQQMTVRDFVSQYGETEFMKNLPAASASAEDLGGAVPSTCLKSGTTSRPGNRETPTTRSFDILS